MLWQGGRSGDIRVRLEGVKESSPIRTGLRIQKRRGGHEDKDHKFDKMIDSIREPQQSTRLPSIEGPGHGARWRKNSPVR